MAVLAHRIEAAQAAHNTQLIELLEREKQQLGQAATPHRGSLAARFNAFKQRVANAFSSKSELQVYQYEQGSDWWWYAFDPRTGDCVYADSEAELRLWIEQNYRGR
ncbi:hypothetical protein H6F51_17395 [Cyanobacteria bacterium FACHB-DQ100]|uniref:hypothetical protein n=1 Tax=Leptolyngbya sp. DQ-M1 TaxID=2933920 RepID=UPI0019B949B0|nr:hypothetical protein [Cyanobacteria bacterium FACHB-DQ100]